MKLIRFEEEKMWLESMNDLVSQKSNNYIPFIDSTGHKSKLLKKYFCIDSLSSTDYYNIEDCSEKITFDESVQDNKVVVSFKHDKFFNYGHIIQYQLKASKMVELNDLSDLNEFMSQTSYEYIVLLLSYESMTLEIFNKVRSWSKPHQHIGFFGGDDVEQLSWLLLKTNLMRNKEFVDNRSIIALPFNEEKEKKGYDNVTVLNKNTGNMTNTIDKFGKEGLRALFTSSHGSEDCVSLSDGFIYGSSVNNKNVKSSPYGDNFTLASNIQSQVVINSTCFGFRPTNNILNKDVSVALTFLEGLTTVYVSSEGIKHGPDAEISFLYNLIYQGKNIGTSVSTLNKWIEQNNFDFPCYFIFGDPSLIVYPENKYSLDYSYENFEDKIIKIEGIKSKSFLDIKLPSSSKLSSYIENTTFNKFSHAFVRYEEETHLYIHNWWPFERENLQVKLLDESPLAPLNFEDNPEKINNLVNNLIINGKFQNDIHALSNRLQSLALKARALPYNSQVFREITESVSKYRNNLDRLQDSIIKKVMKQVSSEVSLFLPEAYVHHTNYNFKEDTTCFICKKDSKSYIFTHLTSFESREAIYCPRCGAIKDSPAENKLRLEIVGDNLIDDYEIYKQYLKVTNISSEKLEGYCGLSHDSVEKKVEVKEIYRKYALKPGEESVFEFEFKPLDKLFPHLYYFKAVALCGFDLYYANKPFTNVPLKAEKIPCQDNLISITLNQ